MTAEANRRDFESKIEVPCPSLRRSMKVYQRVTVLLTTATLLLFYHLWSNHSNEKLSENVPNYIIDGKAVGEDKIAVLGQDIKDTSSKTFVLLNSYMRSGSSFTGELLGHRPDTFYYYEPLWTLGAYGYWKGNQLKCGARTNQCLEKDNLPDALQTLYDVYECNAKMARRVFGLTISNAGGLLDDVKMCRSGAQKNKTLIIERCDPLVLRHCMKAQYRVTKVLRLTSDTLEPMLEKYKNLKVIHLFRDPRAVVNSRKKTKWYPSLKDPKNLETEAEALCVRMEYDFEAGHILEKKYPERFKMILYEDLMSDLPRKTKSLFNFLGLPYTESDRKKISYILHEKPSNNAILEGENEKSRISNTNRSKDYAFWWRTFLDLETLQTTNKYCQSVYSKLGYKYFKDLDEMRNMSNPSMSKEIIQPL